MTTLENDLLHRLRHGELTDDEWDTLTGAGHLDDDGNIRVVEGNPLLAGVPFIALVDGQPGPDTSQELRDLLAGGFDTCLDYDTDGHPHSATRFAVFAPPPGTDEPPTCWAAGGALFEDPRFEVRLWMKAGPDGGPEFVAWLESVARRCAHLVAAGWTLEHDNGHVLLTAPTR